MKNINKFVVFILIFSMISIYFVSFSWAQDQSEDKKTDILETTVDTSPEKIVIPQVKIAQETDKFLQAVDPKAYRLDTGDTLRIELMGRTADVFQVVVTPSGDVTLPPLESICARGMSLYEFKRKVKEILNKYYNNFESSVSLIKARNFKVSILGEVKNPGDYIVNPFYKVLDIAGEAKGFTSKASLFNIRLTRSGKFGTKVYLVNLYKVLFLGKAEDDLNLEPGDVIYVPPRRNIVTLKGEVIRPGEYETRRGETIRDLINLAGTTIWSSLDNVVIERKTTSTVPEEVIRLDITKSDADFELIPGDIVSVYSIKLFEDYIILIGEFKNPPGTIKKLKIAEKEKIEYKKRWKCRFIKGDTVLDILGRSEGVTPEADLKLARIFRTNPDGSREAIKIDLYKLLIKGDKAQNIALMPGDIFAIAPELNQVYVVGEVRKPDAFPYIAGQSIVKYIVLAGGPLYYARLTSVKIIRGDPEKPQVYNIDIRTPLKGSKKSIPDIQPGDIIYVPRTEVVSFRDVLSVIQSVVNIYALKKIFE